MNYKLNRFNIQLSVTHLASVSYFEFTKNYHTQKNSHPFRELLYVDSGSVTIESEGYNGVLEENHLLIHKPNEPHTLSCNLENAPDVIIIGFNCDCDKLDAFSQKPYKLIGSQVTLLTTIIKESRNVYPPPYDLPDVFRINKKNEYPFGADQMIRNALEMLLIDIIRELNRLEEKKVTKKESYNISQVHQYITNNFAENHHLDNLSFLFNTNKTYLCSEFKAVYGDSIINFLHKLRIKEAKRLMRTGNYNISQISEMIGYTSVSYFCKVFKKYENSAPSEYIKTVKLHLDS